MTRQTDLAMHPSRQGFTEAERTARDYVCGDCGGQLTVLWRGDKYAAVCARWPEEHLNIKSHAQIEQDEVRGRLEKDPRLMNALAIQGARVPLTTQTLKSLTDAQLQSRIQVAFADIADATPAVRGQIMALAKTYGLDPVFDIMIYQKVPYIRYEGRLRKLREAPNYRGHKIRPLTAAEKAAWSFKPDDLVVQCDADMGPKGIVTDFGVVRAIGETSPVAKAHPQQLAIKRAVARVSKQAVGIDLPDWDDVASGSAAIDVREVHPAQQQLPAGDAEDLAGWDEAISDVENETPAPPPVDHWAENRRLTIRAQELHLTGVPTLPSKSNVNVVEEANRVLAERIANVELDQKLAAEGQP